MIKLSEEQLDRLKNWPEKLVDLQFKQKCTLSLPIAGFIEELLATKDLEAEQKVEYEVKKAVAIERQRLKEEFSNPYENIEKQIKILSELVNTEIPSTAEIESARFLLEQYKDAARWRYTKGLEQENRELREKLADCNEVIEDAIEKAIISERKRCAKIITTEAAGIILESIRKWTMLTNLDGQYQQSFTQMAYDASDNIELSLTPEIPKTNPSKNEFPKGLVKDEICNRNGCIGVIEDHEKDGCCSCHINPPCSYCVDDVSFCPICGWEAE